MLSANKSAREALPGAKEVLLGAREVLLGAREVLPGSREVIPGLNVVTVGLATVFIFSTPVLSARLRSLLDASGKTIIYYGPSATCIRCSIWRAILIHPDIYLIFYIYYQIVNRYIYLISAFLLTTVCTKP
jgi:hypothetical protein